MFGLVKSPPKDHSLFMFFGYDHSRVIHMPFCIPRVMLIVYMVGLVLDFSMGDDS